MPCKDKVRSTNLTVVAPICKKMWSFDR